MRRVVALALGVLPLLAVPARAQQLTYTTHAEIRKVEAPLPNNPVLTPIYANLALVFSRTSARDLPDGSVDFTIALSPKELRVHATKPTGSLSEGTTQVIHANQSALFVNSASKTFWQFPEPPAAALAVRETRIADLTPSISIKRLGEFSMIAGINAEHVTFDVTLNPFGMPPSLRDQGINLEITGEAWLAPQYRSYAALQSRTYPMSPTGAPILRQLDDIGFPVRVILRGAMFGGYEVERTVTKIVEEPASVYDVPAGYTEIYAVRPGVTAPQKIKEVKPMYTPQAMRARLEGAVLLEVAVGIDGKTRDVRVLRSLDAQFGLDQKAIDAVRQWEFTPALRGAAPINALATVEIAFTLRDGPRPPAATPPAAR